MCEEKKWNEKREKRVSETYFSSFISPERKENSVTSTAAEGRLPRPRSPASCRRLTVSIFLVFVFFLFTISARQLYTPLLYRPPHRHTITIRNIHHHYPLHHHHSLPTLMSRPLTRAYCCTVYFGNNANGDRGTMGSGGGGIRF